MRASQRAMATGLVVLLLGAPPARAASVIYNTYWGDLHGHTMDSPVTLTTSTIDNYIRYARDTKGLQFVALTEKDFDLSASEWSDCRSRAAAFTSSSFVAFSAFEWGDEGYGDFGIVRSITPPTTSLCIRARLPEPTTSANCSMRCNRTPTASPASPIRSQQLPGRLGLLRRQQRSHRRGVLASWPLRTGDRGLQQALANGYRSASWR
jgi:hypothetical protein